MTDAPAERRDLEPRWRLAAGLAGLCHDVGKPVSDLSVSDREGRTTWRPLLESLTDWATANGIEDPLDLRVVDAYWIGNALSDRVDPVLMTKSIDARFRTQLPAETWKPWPRMGIQFTLIKMAMFSDFSLPRKRSIKPF